VAPREMSDAELGRYIKSLRERAARLRAEVEASGRHRPQLTLLQGGGEVDPPSTDELIEAMGAPSGRLNDEPAIQRLLAWQEQQGGAA
jgi:hypothetical protein